MSDTSSAVRVVRQSRFARYYQRGEDVCFFHSLTMDVLFGCDRLLEFFLSFPAADQEPETVQPTDDPEDDTIEAIDLFCQKGLLVENGERDEKLLDEYIAKGENQHRGQLSLMYLLPTSRCNLDCKYCFIGRELDAPSSLMTEETALQAVRYFFRHSPKASKRKIIFYGGEPLLNASVLLAAADEAIRLTELGRQKAEARRQKDQASGKKHRGRRKPLELNLTLLTNGLLVTPELARELAARKISVSVSIDGPQDVHDQNRLTRDGEPTFERAVAALGILREAGLKPSISCTVTDASLEQWDRVQSLIIDDLKLHGLGFNILLPGPCGESSLRYSGRLDPTSALLQAYDRFRGLGIYEDRVMRRVKPFVNHRFHFKDCLGVGGQIAVAPDGSVGPCQGMLGNADYFPLNVFRDFETSPYENALFDEWTKRFPLKFEECLECPAIALCGGGCPIASLREEGTIWEIDRRICEQVKPIHEWLLWDLHKNHQQVMEEEAATAGPE